MYKCVCICVCSHAHGSEKRVSTPLDYTEQANGVTHEENIIKAGDSGFHLTKKKLVPCSEMKFRNEEAHILSPINVDCHV